MRWGGGSYLNEMANFEVSKTRDKNLSSPMNAGDEIISWLNLHL